MKTISCSLLLPMLVSAAVLGAMAVLTVPSLGQAATDQCDWEKAAGGEKEFEVASIRRSEPGTFLRPNMVLNNEDTPVPPGGRFSADFPLEIYIEFAYKIMPTREQEDAILAHLPKWVSTDHFVIEAEAEGHPTKDQIRLMMQSLLADRFKLVVHFETKVVPVFELILDKPGKIGPRIRQHSEGPACDALITLATDRSSPSVPPGEFLPSCGRVQAIDGPDQTVVLGARSISLEHLAGYLPDFEDIGRPVVDQTGLGGTFDFSLNWSPEQNGVSQAGANESMEVKGPSFLTALRDQLGLRLKPATAPIQVLVVDHVEQLSPN